MHFFDSNQDNVVTLDEFNAAAIKRFQQMDENSDGVVTTLEFRNHMSDRRAEMRTHRFKEMDTDTSHTLSKSEFVEFQRQRAEKRFQRMDINGDGELSKEEFAQAKHRKKHFGGKNPRNFLFQKLDLNGNGEITAEESLRAWTDWFKRIDANSDQLVTAEEVKNYRANKWKVK